MRVRAQMSMLFHLDKCIGCHTCSVACKNLWTDRDGAEYMWWNNVETRPGTGYPTGWEDQDHYKGGWHRDKKGRLKLVLHSKGGGVAKAFYNPALPELEDYYDPFTLPVRRPVQLTRPAPSSRQRSRSRRSPASRSRSRPVRTGTTTSAGPTSSPPTTPRWRVSTTWCELRWKSSSGSSSTTCRGSATTA